jgi:hypothetical protein
MPRESGGQRPAARTRQATPRHLGPAYPRRRDKSASMRLQSCAVWLDVGHSPRVQRERQSRRRSQRIPPGIRLTGPIHLPVPPHVPHAPLPPSSLLGDNLRKSASRPPGRISPSGRPVVVSMPSGRRASGQWRGDVLSASESCFLLGGDNPSRGIGDARLQGQGCELLPQAQRRLGWRMRQENAYAA